MQRITPLLLLSLAGCSVVVDAGRFEQAEDFEAFVTNMGEFVDIPFMVTLVDEDGQIAATSVLDGVLLADATMDGVPARVFSAVDPRQDYDVIVVADENGDGGYDANTEPTWFEPEVVDSVASVRGGRENAITTADPPRMMGGDFVFTLQDFDGPHAGQRFELVVFDFDEGRGVGSFFTRAVPDTPEFTVTIPGIIQQGHSYELQFYADLDRSESLTEGDHRWREEYFADGTDLVETFVHAAPFDADLDAF